MEKTLNLKRYSILVGTLLFCGVFVLAILIATRGERNSDPGPVYKGKTVSDWINSIQTSNASDVASTNLIEIGDPAVPYLIKAVEWKPSFRDKFSRVLFAHGRGLWSYRLGLSDPESLRQKLMSKRGAMRVLQFMGPSGKEALPALRRVARGDEDWGNRAWALSAIIGIGAEQPDAPLFIQALKDAQPIVRVQGARGLGKIAKPAPESIEALKAALQEPDEQVRKLAYEVLEKIDPRPKSSLDSSQSK